jgi:hypothetical protein
LLFSLHGWATQLLTTPPDPNGNKFQGRQVYEQTATPGTDTCWSTASASPPGPPYTQVTGGWWNVGYQGPATANAYGSDAVGISPERISYYYIYSAGDLPCSMTIPQQMYITNQIPWPGMEDNLFANHTLTITLHEGWLYEVSKDSVSQIKQLEEF